MACATIIAIGGIQLCAQAPDTFETNYQIGEYYLHRGKLREGIPYMEKAQALQPSNYVVGYDLALAYFDVKEYDKARHQLEAMLQQKNSAELHSLLADVDEAAGDYVNAANEYQRAARLDPSEERIFDWGSELLTHRAPEAAEEVFTRGLQLHPRSARLTAGLGIAFYLRGDYEHAIRALCSAADLDPSDSWPYVFLGKMYDISSPAAKEVQKRLAHFAQLRPRNPQALYYYAMSLWGREQNSQANLPQVEALLRRAISLDPKYVDAHLQLGILLSDERRYAEAIQQFQRAIALQPNLTTAHYHLAQCYLRTGEKPRAEQELQIFKRLHQQDDALSKEERNQVKQFVVNMKSR